MVKEGKEEEEEEEEATLDRVYLTLIALLALVWDIKSLIHWRKGPVVHRQSVYSVASCRHMHKHAHH